MINKKDYSEECSRDDDNDTRCWNCVNFIFPIGCIKDEKHVFNFDDKKETKNDKKQYKD